jgi:O-Antigen ligase
VSKCLSLTQESSHFYRPGRLSSVVAFAVPAIFLLYYALRGGSYDIVPRHEEAIAIWWILVLGWATGLMPRAKPPKSAAIPIIALLLLSLWTLISLSWTSSDERTFLELARFMHYAGVLLLVWSLVTRDNWKAVAGGLVFGSLVVSTLAMASRLDPGAFPTNYITLRFEINRLSYPFNYWNAVGAWTVMSMAMALAWSAHARHIVVRAACLAAVPIAGTAAYVTYSRAAVIDAVIALILVIVLSRNRWVAFVHSLGAAAGAALAISVVRGHHEIVEASGNKGAGSVLLALIGGVAIAVAVAVATWYAKGDGWRLPKRPARIAVVTGILALAIVVPAAGHNTISSRWHEFRHEENTTDTADPAERLSHLNGNRYFIWRSAWDAFKDQPIKGLGAGTYEFWWDEQGGGEFIRDAHNLYLEELGEQGIFGGLLIVTMLGALVFGGLRARRRLEGDDVGLQAGLLAAFGVFLFAAGVDWIWESTAVGMLGVVAGAVAAASLAAPRVRAPRVAWRLPVVAIGIVAALIQLPSLASTVATRDSQGDFNKNKTEAALAEANDAIQAEPWAASPYVQRALVEESMDQLTAARNDLLRAEAKEPKNWRQPLLLARIDAERGDADAALADYKRAKALRPKGVYVNPQFP